MKIFVHIKEKVMKINCGEGAQSVSWLGDVAIFRYKDDNGLSTGMCLGMRVENGNKIPMKSSINEVLQDEQHVWVILQDDMEAIELQEGQNKYGQRRRRRR